MSDPDFAEHIVSGINPPQDTNSWRWTQKRPTLKVLLLETEGLKFLADFTIWEGTMKQTGPVTISFFIGDKILDKVTYNTPGFKHFEKPVNPDWLQTTTDTVIAAEIDKVYTSPTDGTKLGFILTRMGFAKAE